MKMIMFNVFIYFSLIVLTYGVILNENVERYIDLTTQIVKIEESITFQNLYKSNISVYNYVLEDPLNAQIEFYQNNEKLLYDIVICKNKTYKEFVIKLANSVKSYNTSKLIVKLARVNQIKLLNKNRRPGENQIFEYTGNVYFYSEYITKKFQCVINIKNPIIEMTEKFHEKDDTIIYKTIELKPYSTKIFNIIFVNNEPLYVVNHLERTIDVSHYGKIFIQEKINITNAGSTLIGPYNPFKNNRRIWFHTYLPSSSEDIRFFDVLGNNSKTEVSPNIDFKTLNFQLRYPLLGGWKSSYILQYTLPTYEYLKTTYNGYFELKMRVIDHIMNDIVIHRAVVKVILPEGTRITRINTPDEFYRSIQGLSFTSLSISGRPTVIFTGNMLTENHILPFTITYYLSSVYLYRIPIILAAYVQIVFLIIIMFRYYNT